MNQLWEVIRRYSRFKFPSLSLFLFLFFSFSLSFPHFCSFRTTGVRRKGQYGGRVPHGFCRGQEIGHVEILAAAMIYSGRM